MQQGFPPKKEKQFSCRFLDELCHPERSRRIFTCMHPHCAQDEGKLAIPAHERVFRARSSTCEGIG